MLIQRGVLKEGRVQCRQRLLTVHPVARVLRRGGEAQHRLNEGEAAVVQAGALRIDHAHLRAVRRTDQHVLRRKIARREHIHPAAVELELLGYRRALGKERLQNAAETEGQLFNGGGKNGRVLMCGRAVSIVLGGARLVSHTVQLLQTALSQTRRGNSARELRLAVGTRQVQAVILHRLAHNAAGGKGTVRLNVVVQRIQRLLFGALQQGVGDRILLALNGSGAHILQSQHAQLRICAVELREQTRNLPVQRLQTVALTQVPETARVHRRILTAVTLHNNRGRQRLCRLERLCRLGGRLIRYTHHNGTHAGTQNLHALHRAASHLPQRMRPAEQLHQGLTHRGRISARLRRHGGVGGNRLLNEGAQKLPVRGGGGRTVRRQSRKVTTKGNLHRAIIPHRIPYRA